jgi:hypothetical protein
MKEWEEVAIPSFFHSFIQCLVKVTILLFTDQTVQSIPIQAFRIKIFIEIYGRVNIVPLGTKCFSN